MRWLLSYRVTKCRRQPFLSLLQAEYSGKLHLPGALEWLALGFFSLPDSFFNCGCPFCHVPHVYLIFKEQICGGCGICADYMGYYPLSHSPFKPHWVESHGNWRNSYWNRNFNYNHWLAHCADCGLVFF